jgi:uncharacterized protein YjiS (DUF1127 family)
MANTITNSTPFHSESLFQRVKQYLKARADYRADRIAYTRMLGMSNRDLADMGLTCDDVREAMIQPMSRRGTR